MGTTEQDVARHKTHGALEDAILGGLAALGPAADSDAVEQLAAVDEFHIGGREATADIADRLGLQPGLRVLDVGCEIASERHRREFALAFFQRMKARAAQGGPPPLGLHIMMVEDAPAKVANMIANLERALIAPVEMIARRP